MCRWAMLWTSEEQEAEILLRVHRRILICGRGGEGGEVWLHEMCLLTAFLAASIFGEGYTLLDNVGLIHAS